MTIARFLTAVSLVVLLLDIQEVVNLSAHINERWANDTLKSSDYVDNDSEPNSNHKITLVTGTKGDISVLYGVCSPNDHMLHTENIIIENEGPSTLRGVFEFYIDLTAQITCVEIQDKGDRSSKSSPLLSAGGPGHDWLAVKVRGKYGRGVFVLVKVFGVLDKSALSKQSSNQ